MASGEFVGGPLNAKTIVNASSVITVSDHNGAYLFDDERQAFIWRQYENDDVIHIRPKFDETTTR